MWRSCKCISKCLNSVHLLVALLQTCLFFVYFADVKLSLSPLLQSVTSLCISLTLLLSICASFVKFCSSKSILTHPQTYIHTLTVPSKPCIWSVIILAFLLELLMKNWGLFLLMGCTGVLRVSGLSGAHNTSYTSLASSVMSVLSSLLHKKDRKEEKFITTNPVRISYKNNTELRLTFPSESPGSPSCLTRSLWSWCFETIRPGTSGSEEIAHYSHIIFIIFSTHKLISYVLCYCGSHWRDCETCCTRQIHTCRVANTTWGSLWSRNNTRPGKQPSSFAIASRFWGSDARSLSWVTTDIASIMLAGYLLDQGTEQISYKRNISQIYTHILMLKINTENVNKSVGPVSKDDYYWI